MKNSLVVTLLAFSILLNSCASILSPRKQKVFISTDSDQSVVYVDGVEVGKGRNVVATVKKDMRGKVIRVEKPEHNPAQIVHKQQKKSKWYILTIITSIPLLTYPLWLDMRDNSWVYPKNISVTNNVKIRSRKENEKYIFTSKTAFDLNSKNFVIKLYTNKEKFDKNRFYAEKKSDEKIEISNSIFTDELNKVLKSTGFLDTTNSIMKTKTNTLYIQCVINKFTIHEIQRMYHSSLATSIKTELSMEWQILDVYNQIKHKESNIVISEEFLTKKDDRELSVIHESIRDALSKSFYGLLQTTEVQKLLPIESSSLNYDEKILLSSKAKMPTNFEEAMEATVTVKTNEGHGSGIIVSNNGYILTNFHVVSSSKDLEVILGNGEKLKATLVRKNEINDLALLKVNQNFDIAFSIPSVKNFNIGQEVYAIGTPAAIELGQTLSKGIVSGFRKFDYGEMIQTDVSINFGNSGGPLIKNSAELMGIVNSKIVGKGIEGVAFCIPAYKVFELLGISYE